MRYLLVLLLLAGCSTPKTMNAIGGSKSDGTVRLAYQYGMFEKPVVDYNQALQSAIKRCGAWGYKNAEAFDTGVADCLAYNGYGNCLNTRITVTYQCID